MVIVKYDRKFFDYVDSGALRSAEIMVSWMFRTMQPMSVLDIGCGRGGWLMKWRDAGCETVAGVDGDYVDLKSLYILKDEFKALNISEKFDLGRRFDLVQCLEVAEHIAPSASETLVDNITRHSDVVVFSAALPGQGGTQHINERSLEYWRALFRDRGYQAYDCLRPRFSPNKEIEPWYRYNGAIYANAAGANRLPQPIKETFIEEGKGFYPVEPLSWTIRRGIVRFFPVAVVDKLASVNASIRQYRSRS